MSTNGKDSAPTSKFGKLRQAFRQKVEDYKIKRATRRFHEESEKQLFEEEKREARKEFIKKTAKKAAKKEVEQKFLKRKSGGAVMGILNAFDISQASNRIVRTQVRKKGKGRGKRSRTQTIEVGRERDTSDLGDEIIFGSSSMSDSSDDIIFGQPGKQMNYDPIFGSHGKKKLSEREFLGLG